MRSDNNEEIKTAALAKKKLEELINNKLVWIRIHKKGKYGKYFVTLYEKKSDDIDWKNSFNNKLIDALP